MVVQLQTSPFSPLEQSLLVDHQPIHSRYTFNDLPQSYRTFVATVGAGYFTKSKLPTIEPTRDGLDYVILNGLFGWSPPPTTATSSLFYTLDASVLTPAVTGLPNYFIVFFLDGAKYFCFDFSRLSSTGEPSIRLVDTEMDQWIWIADSFEQLLSLLEYHDEELIDQPALPYSHHEVNQKLGQDFISPEQLTSLFVLYQDTTDQNWYFQWLDFWVHSKNHTLQQVAKKAILFQLEFLAHSLRSVLSYLQTWSKDPIFQDDPHLFHTLHTTLAIFCDR